MLAADFQLPNFKTLLIAFNPTLSSFQHPLAFSLDESAAVLPKPGSVVYVDDLRFAHIGIGIARHVDL